MFENIFYGTGFGRHRLSPARAAYLLLVWVIVPMWLVTRFYTMVLGLAFMGAFQGVGQQTGMDISFRKPFFTWTGDIGLNDFRIEPSERGNGPVQAISVRRVLVDMPNWGVMQEVFAALDEGEDRENRMSGLLAAVNQLDHMGFELQGVQADFLGGVPRVLRGFGLASGAPFETEGCQRDTRWLGSELSDMGIDSSQGVDLRVVLSNDAKLGEVHVEGSVDSPHSSRIDFEQHFRAANMSGFLNETPRQRIAIYERIAVRDAGFVAARNAFCAKRDGVDRATFTERHIAAIRRRLEAMGLRAGPELERAYMAYLREGSFRIEAHPSANVPRSDYHNYAPADQQLMYNGVVSGGALAAVPLRLESVPVRPVPAGFQGNSWDLVAYESEHPEAFNAPAVAALPANFDDEPEEAPPAAPSAAIVSPVAATAAARLTSDGRALASSLPQAASDERFQPQSLEYQDLAAHVGEHIAVTTSFGDRREGRLESVGKSSIELRVYVAAGYAIQHIDRAQIRGIRDLD